MPSSRHRCALSSASETNAIRSVSSAVAIPFSVTTTGRPLTLSMAEITATEGGESLRDAAEEMLKNIFLRANGGDDFVGVQCYTRMHFGPDGLAPNDPEVPLTQMGDERGPRRSSTRSAVPPL